MLVRPQLRRQLGVIAVRCRVVRRQDAGALAARKRPRARKRHAATASPATHRMKEAVAPLPRPTAAAVFISDGARGIEQPSSPPITSPRTSVQQLVRTSAPASPLSGRQRENRGPGRAAAGQQDQVAGNLDAGRESVVEGEVSPRRWTRSQPSDSARRARGASGVVDPEHLHRVEHRLAQRPELVRAVLLQVPRVLRFVRPARGDRQQIGSGDVETPSGASSVRKWRSTSSGSATCSIVCRNATRRTSRAARSARPARARSSGPGCV